MLCADKGACPVPLKTVTGQASPLLEDLQTQHNANLPSKSRADCFANAMQETRHACASAGQDQAANLEGETKMMAVVPGRLRNSKRSSAKDGHCLATICHKGSCFVEGLPCIML